MKKLCLIVLLFLATSSLMLAQGASTVNTVPRKNSKLDTIHVHGFRANEVVQIIQNEGAHRLLLLIDVRTEAEFAAGHINEAINIPMSEFEARIKDTKKKYSERTIITIDEDGSKAMTACGILNANKFKWAYYLKGGMGAWRKDNLPVEH